MDGGGAGGRLFVRSLSAMVVVVVVLLVFGWLSKRSHAGNRCRC